MIIVLIFQMTSPKFFRNGLFSDYFFSLISAIMNKACDYRNSFDTYSYLWVDDRSEFMRQFLLYNHVLTAEEIEAHAEEGVPECPPTLDQFKEQVGLQAIHKLLSISSMYIHSSLLFDSRRQSMRVITKVCMT